MNARLRGPYRKYTAEEKEEAIKLSLEVGGRQAASRLGLPYSTLARWASKWEVAASSNESSPEGEVVSDTGEEKKKEVVGAAVDEKPKGTSKHVAR
ncbi:MAG: transposase, partial [Bradymonadaceae bacterium]